MMTKAINGLKYWGQLVLLPLYWLSFLMPRNKRIWLFGSTFGRRFADNPRYFYLYISQTVKKGVRIINKNTGEEEANPCYIGDKPIRPIWISHDKEIVKFLNKNGYEAYYYHSIKGIWYALCGKVFLFDNYSKDINFWQSGRAIKFNMWHGVPLKMIQHDNIFDEVRHPKSVWKKIATIPRTISDEKPSHYVLTTSEFMKPIFSSAFKTEHVSTVGYPRIDGFLYSDIQNLYTKKEYDFIKQIKCILDQNNDSRIIYYMPTFRDSETKFFDIIDLNSFCEFLDKEHLIFCTKLHPKSKLKKEFDAIQNRNFLVIDANTDPYVFIPEADALVTDYSSIYFDYLFTNKPIIFFDYDLELYLSDERQMYFEYEQVTPGQKVATQSELQDALVSVKRNKDEHKDSREQLRRIIYDNCEQLASKKLVNEIKQLL